MAGSVLARTRSCSRFTILAMSLSMFDAFIGLTKVHENDSPQRESLGHASPFFALPGERILTAHRSRHVAPQSWEVPQHLALVAERPCMGKHQRQFARRSRDVA